MPLAAVSSAPGGRFKRFDALVPSFVTCHQLLPSFVAAN